MKNLFAVRDELIDRYLQPRRRGGVSLAAALPSPRLRGMLSAAAGPSAARAPKPDSVESRVHAIGIAPNDGTGEPGVVVYVTRKLEKDKLSASALVPPKIQGVVTDVVQSPMARLAAGSAARKQRVRPLVAGVSIGRADGPSGTLGAFVRSTRTADRDEILLLSNSHVLAPDSGRVQGTAVVQSSTDDGEPETIGSVLRATRLHRTLPISVDAAVAQLDPPSLSRMLFALSAL